MKVLLVLLLLSGLVLTGCAAVARDLEAARDRALAAQTAGLLGPNDPLPKCLAYFVGVTGAQSAVLKGPFAGIIDLGTDIYILDAMSQAGGTSDALDQACGGVAVKILKNAGRRAPGL